MPERTRTVVVNTTPIIALALIGQLDLLQHLYGEVVIPPAVQAEYWLAVRVASVLLNCKEPTGFKRYPCKIHGVPTCFLTWTEERLKSSPWHRS